MKDTTPIEELIEKVRNQAQVALDHPFAFQKPLKKIAVIGAGLSGLCSAQVLLESGFEITVFERAEALGGLWNYTDTAPLKPSVQQKPAPETKTEDVPEKGKLEAYPQIENITHALLKRQPPTACYTDLLTNVPMKYMCFPNYVFCDEPNVSKGHDEILKYINKYADHFDLRRHIQFNTCVESVCKKGDEWELVLCLYQVDSKGLKETRWREKFDAVVAASGLHQEPFIPDIPGLAEFDARWPEKISHSKQFRSPETFKDKNVLIVGSGISGVDIARSLDKIASSVIMTYKSSWTSPISVINYFRNCVPSSVTIKPELVSFGSTNEESSGAFKFKDGTNVSDIDHVIFCTGYKHSLGYLKQVSPADADVPESHTILGRSCPLNTFFNTFLISDPTLAFSGLTSYLTISPFYYTQSVFMARIWKGQAKIPHPSQMIKFDSEHDIGKNPDLYDIDRCLRQLFVTWLNHQAKNLHLSLPEVFNYEKDYKNERILALKQWSISSDRNFQFIKEKARKKAEETLK
ncbi:hypothetical protein BY458DRAFT_559853 [Sporodiniella umbellata]|nr:hypothetical protein BY458DRAFT_559853 [Sporodiniella umbellata]